MEYTAAIAVTFVVFRICTNIGITKAPGCYDTWLNQQPHTNGSLLCWRGCHDSFYVRCSFHTLGPLVLG